MSSKESTLIIGSAGQVGRALFRAMKHKFNVYKQDIVKIPCKEGFKYDKADPKQASGLITHICIPFSDKFEEEITKVSETYNPSLMIIHSSINPGTTKLLFDKGLKVVHSPTFFDERDFRTIINWRKPIGFDDSDLGVIAMKHISQYLNCVPVQGSKNTELAEICLGLYCSVCVGVCQEIGTIFKAMDCSYDIMTGMIDEHNMGCNQSGKPREMLMNPVDKNKIKNDYRIENINLLPINLVSPYFKLTVKSNQLFKERTGGDNV
tara:strand:+ start:17090 stop:17881 length:792 start_codon:yes stop_codon:yes gene_type:complete